MDTSPKAQYDKNFKFKALNFKRLEFKAIKKALLENFKNSKQRYHSKTFKLVEQIALLQAICRLLPQAKINKVCTDLPTLRKPKVSRLARVLPPFYDDGGFCHFDKSV